MKEIFKEELKDFKPYEPDQETGYIKLNANENPYDFSPEFKKLLAQEVMNSSYIRYCDSAASRLRTLLGEYTGFSAEEITVGNGSSELIRLLMTAFLRAGEKIVSVDPTFTMYQVIAAVEGIRSEGIPLKQDFSIDTEAILRSAQEETVKMVFLCTPNNPTGAEIPMEDILRVVECVDCLVVIDEAYGEFTENTYLPLVKRYPHVVVLRTMSKGFGIAGLRVGYAVAQSQISREINKVRLPYNLNAFSQQAACLTLEHREEMQENIVKIVSERERLLREMGKIPGVIAYPSAANFILFKTKLPGSQLDRGLREDKILIRDFSTQPLLKDCMRVTVGTPQENDAFLAALRKTMERG